MSETITEAMIERASCPVCDRPKGGGHHIGCEIGELAAEVERLSDLVEALRISEETLNRAVASEVDLRNQIYDERVATAESFRQAAEDQCSALRRDLDEALWHRIEAAKSHARIDRAWKALRFIYRNGMNVDRPQWLSDIISDAFGPEREGGPNKADSTAEERAASGLRNALSDVLAFVVDEDNTDPGNAGVKAWWHKHAAVLADIPRPGDPGRHVSSASGLAEAERVEITQLRKSIWKARNLSWDNGKASDVLDEILASLDARLAELSATPSTQDDGK